MEHKLGGKNFKDNELVLDAIKYTRGEIVLKGISFVMHAVKMDISKRTLPRIKSHLRPGIKWGLHVSHAINSIITQMNV